MFPYLFVITNTIYMFDGIYLFIFIYYLVIYSSYLFIYLFKLFIY